MKYNRVLKIMSFLCFVILITTVSRRMHVNHQLFRQIEFSLPSSNGPPTRGIVIIPQPVVKYSVVFYFPSPGNFDTHFEVLRQFSDAGLAALTLDVGALDKNSFASRVLAAQTYLQKQPWAMTNGFAWVAEGALSNQLIDFLSDNPDCQPRVFVQLGRGKTQDNSVNHSTNAQCQFLLIQAEDEKFSDSELSKLGAQIEVRTLPFTTLAVRSRLTEITRAIADYCALRLPTAAYTAVLTNRLTNGEASAFDAAMRRAGKNKRELWKAVTSLTEPERRTAMIAISKMEDYDLANVSENHLIEMVQTAWDSRRKYPWSQTIPLDVFETFVASTRFFEEPLDQFSAVFAKRLEREIKYCRTSEEVCDRIFYWMHLRASWRNIGIPEARPSEVLSEQGGGCEEVALLYTSLARSAGVAVRPCLTFWQHMESFHVWTEIWDSDTRKWHAIDCTANDRPYRYNWMALKPKPVIYSKTGKPGAWNALAEGRWEVFTNVINECYPNGVVEVQILQNNQPVTNQWVIVEMYREQFTSIARSKTDDSGNAYFVLGECYAHPYRISAEQSGETDWKWVNVRSNGIYQITLNLEKKPSFNPTELPPALVTLSN